MNYLLRDVDLTKAKLVAEIEKYSKKYSKESMLNSYIQIYLSGDNHESTIFN